MKATAEVQFGADGSDTVIKRLHLDYLVDDVQVIKGFTINLSQLYFWFNITSKLEVYTQILTALMSIFQTHLSGTSDIINDVINTKISDMLNDSSSELMEKTEDLIKDMINDLLRGYTPENLINIITHV